MTITVDLSDSALKALDAKTSDDAVANLRLAAAMKLYELGRLSTGAAADLAGLGRVEFLDRLAEIIVPFQVDQELDRQDEGARCSGPAPALDRNPKGCRCSRLRRAWFRRKRRA